MIAAPSGGDVVMTHLHPITRPAPTPNPDADLQALLERIEACWRECAELDEVGWPSEKAKALTAEACRLERQLIDTAAHTHRELVIKIKAIKAAEFDGDDLPEILDGIAKDIERIGAVQH